MLKIECHFAGKERARKSSYKIPEEKKDLKERQNEGERSKKKKVKGRNAEWKAGGKGWREIKVGGKKREVDKQEQRSRKKIRYNAR